jgi:hypothetical protein
MKHAAQAAFRKAINPFFRVLAACLIGLSVVKAALPVIPTAVKTSISDRMNYAYAPSIVVGLVNAEGRAYFGYGVANKSNSIPANEHTVFEIAFGIYKAKEQPGQRGSGRCLTAQEQRRLKNR